MKTTLTELIKVHQIKTILADAFGVLYNDQGLFHGMKQTFSILKQNKIQLILLTNNSNEYTDIIAKKFSGFQIPIPPEHIISSGHGLALDPDTQKLIKGKNVYVFGTKSSYQYVYDAQPNQITDDLKKAKTIIMTAHLNTKQYQEHYTKMLNFLKKNKEIPVICCNPDRYVLTTEGLYPVIGFWAEQLEKLANIKIHWIGKPYQNFSEVVRKKLEMMGIQTTHQVCFFDDNLDNVSRMVTDLDILGAVVSDTGLSKGIELLEKRKTHKFHFTIPEFKI